MNANHLLSVWTSIDSAKPDYPKFSKMQFNMYHVSRDAGQPLNHERHEQAQECATGFKGFCGN